MLDTSTSPSLSFYVGNLMLPQCYGITVLQQTQPFNLLVNLLTNITDFFYLGISLQFATKVFQAVVNEKDFNSLTSILRKAELENKLMVIQFIV